MRKIALLCIILSTSLLAQDKPASRCSDSQYNDFDFWLGEWKVTMLDQEGNRVLAGHNTISKVEGNCVIHERWRGQSGYTGQSFNGYDKSKNRWQQTWMDNQGTVLTLVGGLQADDMVLSGEGPASDGSNTRWQHEIRWHLDTDSDDVTQTWRAKADPAAEWQVLFSGLYQRHND